MSEDRNAIAQELTDDQLDKFLQEFAARPKKQRRLVDFQEKAQSDFGLTISIMSAKSFRDTTFSKYIKRMERRREFAERVTNAPAAGASYAEAAAENLAEAVYDMTEEINDAMEEGAPLDLKKASATAFIISKIQQGTTARGNLQLKINDFERREREREQRNAEAQAKLQKLRDPNAGLNETERTAILDEVDRLMGVK